MKPERIVQLSLGVPDAVDPDRRRDAAIKTLAFKAGFNPEHVDLDEAKKLWKAVEAVYQALLGALAAGGLDDALIVDWPERARSAIEAIRAKMHPFDHAQATLVDRAISDWR